MTRRLGLLAAAGIAAVSLAGASAGGAPAGTQCLVINEVYSAGGSVGATYNRNFVELLNRCATSTALNGVTCTSRAGAGPGRRPSRSPVRSVGATSS